MKKIEHWIFPLNAEKLELNLPAIYNIPNVRYARSRGFKDRSFFSFVGVLLVLLITT